MKKVIKFFFITLLTLFVLLLVFIMIVANGGEEGSDNKEELADKAMMQITAYHHTNGHYPKSLGEIPIYADPQFITYVKNNTFKYSLYDGDIPKYVFSWRDGAMNWTGYRCTNDKSELSQKQNGVVRVYTRPDGVVCTVSDLH